MYRGLSGRDRASNAGRPAPPPGATHRRGTVHLSGSARHARAATARTNLPGAGAAGLDHGYRRESAEHTAPQKTESGRGASDRGDRCRYRCRCGREPFYPPSHIGGVANQLMIGPTGSGKSAALGVSVAATTGLLDARIVWLDVDYSSFVLAHALGAI